ncbi:2Fe-2S iron-sulfur cluster-binding protein [Niallia endozanthoxylica]|nr:2Fe-2S iron-sulfur cluster binding domain-containing protein [Niallia endozanthoxylica]
MFKIKVMDTNDTNYEWQGYDSESLLDGAQRNGIKIPYACKGGGCGLCKVKVEAGSFKRGKSSIAVLPEDERVYNHSLACKTYPKGDMEILLNINTIKSY